MKYYLKASLFIISLTLAACGDLEKPLSSEQQIQDYAKHVKIEILAHYLDCYALAPASKQQCHQTITKNHPHIIRNINKDYIGLFQFEAEKQGFKHFLLKENLPCESINEGPKFVEENNAYLINCVPDHKYLMRFDYANKKWNLVR